MSQQTIGANPTGFLGRLAGRIMNLLHNKQYKSIIIKIMATQSDPKITIMDIGCGGGVAINHFINISPLSRVLGIDLSPDMVKLASVINHKAISEGRARIFCESIEETSIESKSVNLMTVFDNINFWKSYEKAFCEIKRILKDDGKLFIINEYPEKGTKWYEFVKFKDFQDYQKLLENHGFIAIYHELVGHTLIIEASFRQ